MSETCGLLRQGQNAVSNRGGSSQTGSGPRGSIPAVTVFGCVRRQRFAPFRCAVRALADSAESSEDPDWAGRIELAATGACCVEESFCSPASIVDILIGSRKLGHLNPIRMKSESPMRQCSPQIEVLDDYHFQTNGDLPNFEDGFMPWADGGHKCAQRRAV